MALKKLHEDVQNLISASIKLRSYKTAIEELIYNALDADSTSIAVRINIEENAIQLIDNGCGISSKDFTLLGQRYATSKCADLSTLKSVPNKYGYRGQFISALIQVSESLKITSRSQDSEETWCKVFEEGKEKDLCETARRPSKGTTVEIKGFLYNLKIRKKSIDPLQEIREIKSFLEQLSLVHSNVSISLRDDSNNDIIFKIHKHRDIYQTLSTLFNVEKGDIQELTVEKNQYKTIAYISKKDKEISAKHWIFVNGRLTQNVKLHKMVNDQLKNTLRLKQQARRKIKSRTVFNEDEKGTSDDRLPFYVIFLTCPYYDYDVSNTPKHSMLELKNWENINKLLGKLIKFYAGDLNLKDVKGQDKIVALQPKPIENDTRDQVRKIVEKMLGSTIKRPGVSQMQNGIKGKLIKRKPKKPTISNKKDASVSKVITAKSISSADIRIDTVEKTENNLANETGFLESCTKINHNPEKKRHKKKAPKRKMQSKLEIRIAHIAKEPIQNTIKYKNKSVDSNSEEIKAKRNSPKPKTVENKGLIKSKHKQNSKLKSKTTVNVTKTEIKKKITEDDDVAVVTEKAVLGNPLLDKFKRQTDTLKRNCALLEKNVDNLLKRKKSEPEAFVDQTSPSRMVERNKDNISKNQHNIDEVVIHNNSSKSRPTSCSPCTFDNRNWTVLQKNVFKTNYDLLHTILTIQKKEDRLTPAPKAKENFTSDNRDRECLDYSKYFEKPQDLNDDPESCVNDFTELVLTTSPELTLPDPTLLEPTSASSHSKTRTKLTYESHNYGRFQLNKPDLMNKQHYQRNFITMHSRNNFDIRDKSEFKANFKIGFQKRLHNQFQPYIRKSLSNLFKKNKTWMQNMEDTEYTIEFSNSKERYQCFGFSNQHGDERQHDINRSPDLQQETYIVEQRENESDHNKNCYTNTSRTSPQVQISNQSHASSKGSRQSHKTYSAEPLQTYIVSDEDQHNECNNFAQSNNAINETDINIDNGDKEVAKYIQDQDNINSIITFSQDSNNNAVKSVEKFNTIYSQDEENERSVVQSLHPLNVYETVNIHDEGNEKNVLETLHPLNLCETIHSQEVEECLGSRITFNDSIFNEGFDSIFLDRNIYITTSNFEAFDIPDYEYQQNVANDALNAVERNETENNMDMEELNQRNNAKLTENNQATNVNVLQGMTNSTNEFNFKMRPRFIPKGLSPIFENCRTKNPCGHELEREYYEESIYHNFANKVQEKTEIFEPKIQDMKELTTKDIEKVNSRRDKENAALIFDGESLKNTQVLNQVDNKFIVAKIRGKPHRESRTAKEYLVMFDQHAVHERIRLEKNLADYFNGQEWKSVALDELTVKLSKDDILFLHNYRDKFMQFGLEWTISDGCEVSITAIPEAVLGKNPRQVDLVIKALKNLISEEIAAIKSQKGCIFLYPKSIMDLVFSEACRYAIKFGDRLSRSECQRLIKSLSECKTPFQCAHGRPVMAVLMEVKHETMEYKVDLLPANVSKIYQLCKMMKK